MFFTEYRLFGVLYLILGTSSHFLGGTVKWMTISDEVKFTFRIAWERGTGPCGPGCTEADIMRTGDISLPMLRGLQWICTSSSGTVQVGDVNYIMTSISRKPNGWEQGEGFFKHKLNGTGPFLVSLENFSWVPTNSSTAPSLGYMKTVVNLNIRGDTRKPNGSPYASLPSIIGIQYNCISTIKLPVDDPDADLIRCRWAEPEECQMGCTNVPPNTVILDMVECTLTVHAHASTGYLPNQNYRLTLVVEDFPEYVLDFGGQNLTRRHRMSSVPLQFSVKVLPLFESCDITRNEVKFVSSYPRHRFSYGDMQKKNNSLVRAPMYLAYDDNETEFMASVPARTSITMKPDNKNRTNVTIFQSEMLPQLPDQAGDNQFCAWANNKIGITTDLRCVIENIDDENNCSRTFCKNNGTCINLYHREKCRCPFGFKPPDCIQSVNCADSPCENNATCTNTGKDYACVCIPGFTGANCEHEVNECASNPCQNNGTCLDLRNGFQCICQANYIGHRCENARGTNEPYTSARGINEPYTTAASSNQIYVEVNNNLTWPILAAIIGGLLCGALLMACCCWFLIGRSNKRDEDGRQKDNKPKPQPRWAYARRISMTPFPIPRGSKKDLPALKLSKTTDDLSLSEEVPALDMVADPVTMWPYMKSFNAKNSEKLSSDSTAQPISNPIGNPQICNIYRSSANDPHIHKCGKHLHAEEYFQYM